MRSVDSLAARGTVAHEATHALQYQNFPSLLATRNWFNRDLSAAVNAATEGDAHVIGASLDATKRLDICLMDPAKPGAAVARLWQWHPQAVWAHEAFPHVFGPETALRRWLDAGSAGADDLLRNPPLSTREVLNPELPGAVDFIALPDDLLTAALAKRDCAVGLTNTVGALGIWGLLAEHGEADASDTVAPALVDHWLGDRFAHVSCPGAGDDELAWVIRWRTAHAAGQFVERYRAIAESIAAVGGVLTAPPMPFQHERTVVVVTPGMQDTVAALAEARVRTFTRFSDWIASGCFPQSECYIDTPPAATDGSHLCSQKAGQEPSAGEREGPAPRMEEPSAGEREGLAPRMKESSAGEREGLAPRTERTRIDQWLDRVRKMRSSTAERDGLQTAADTLSDFCVANWLDNEDIALACAAASSGVRNWLQRDCIGSPAPESSRPANIEAQATETASELWPKFPKLFGIPLAERRAASNGLAGLLALTTEPPLSTSAIFRQSDAPVDIIRLPRRRLATLGCEVAASHVRGALGTWTYLLGHGSIANAPAPPAFLWNWQGDRLAHLRCGEHEGWIWLTRWANEESARQLASLLPPKSNVELSMREAAPGTFAVWSIPGALAAAKKVIEEGMEIRTYATFGAWVADGCFPKTTCD